MLEHTSGDSGCTLCNSCSFCKRQPMSVPVTGKAEQFALIAPGRKNWKKRDREPNEDQQTPIPVTNLVKPISYFHMVLQRYAVIVDGTIPIQALLYTDEQLLASQEGVGIYDGFVTLLSDQFIKQITSLLLALRNLHNTRPEPPTPLHIDSST